METQHFGYVSRCFHKSVLKRAKGISCMTHYEQFHGCFISPRFTGPTKGELCRQLGVVILVDDQLQNILDAVSHGLFDDLSETILVTLTVGSVGMCMLSFRTEPRSTSNILNSNRNKSSNSLICATGSLPWLQGVRCVVLDLQGHYAPWHLEPQSGSNSGSTTWNKHETNLPCPERRKTGCDLWILLLKNNTMQYCIRCILSTPTST